MPVLSCHRPCVITSCYHATIAISFATLPYDTELVSLCPTRAASSSPNVAARPRWTTARRPVRHQPRRALTAPRPPGRGLVWPPLSLSHTLTHTHARCASERHSRPSPRPQCPAARPVSRVRASLGHNSLQPGQLQTIVYKSSRGRLRCISTAWYTMGVDGIGPDTRGRSPRR
jgi:hypothetical protein